MQRKSVVLQVLRVSSILACLLLPAWASGQTPLPLEFGRLDVTVDGVSHQLETMTVRPTTLGKHPLAVVTHGSGRSGAAREESPTKLSILARELAARGWLTVVVMRRGYGISSGFAGDHSACDSLNYVAATTEIAKDLRAAIDSLRKRDDVEADTVIVAGHSVGGAGAFALSSRAPDGLRAIINFAGGGGSFGGTVCQPDRLVAAVRTFGETSRLPGLWIYAENDLFFGPDLVRRMHEAFTGAGGKADLVMRPPHGADGHTMVATRSGRHQWTTALDEFLRRNNLPTSASTSSVSEARAEPPPPAGLSERGRREWQNYLDAPDNRAFAVAPSGGFGWAGNRRTDEAARTAALRFCNKPDCAVVQHAPMP